MSKGKKFEIVNFVQQFLETEGIFPTLNEIKKGVGLKSVSTVHQHVRDLVASGVFIDNGFGSYDLAPSIPTHDEIAIIGYITAGSPIEAIEDESKQNTITIPNLPPHSNFYALQVKGDSMVEDGIFDGDIVIIKHQTSAQNGQTVVAIIDDNKTTLKKIYREDNKFRLQPANQTMLPLFRDEVEIRGVVWSIHRNMNSNIHEKTSTTSTKNWRTLDLFAGVGGIRLGFEKAGFSTVFANDFDSKCADTYNQNFNTNKLIVEDITKIHTKDIPDFDILLGGFPCQAFSIAGYRKGFKDETGRGNLFFDIARILKDKQPTGFLLENVKNLKSHDGGNTFKIIEKTLINLGYHIKSKVLNSMEYGNVPQNRERIYIVGFKDKTKITAFEFPKPLPLTKTIKDILEKDVDNKYYYNGKPLYPKLKNEIDEEGQVYQWRRKYVRKNKKGVSPTLTANMGMGGHNVPIIFDGKGIRKFTPRECFRIQGFPDNYKLPTISDSALYKQAGNSVSVPVIEQLAIQMAKVL